MGSIFISAIHKSSGKTVVSLGLAAALTDKGISVQTFKKGPDYIDPMWLSQASGRKCRNLDFHFMTTDEIISEFTKFGADKEISIIEGNKGLHDGLDLKGCDSNASLAKLIGSPVILVLDSRGITRGAAPLIQGQIEFDKEVKFGGVILNNVAGSRHEKKLTGAIEHFTEIPVLGSIPRSSELVICERHLGLIPSNEALKPDQIIKKAKNIIRGNVDLKKIIDLAESADSPTSVAPPPAHKSVRHGTVRIAVALDEVFGFYYPNDFSVMESAGAKLIFFDTLKDPKVPPADGMFIGGGFPETNAEKLSRNVPLRKNILDLLNKGMPAYAECGGLMYLSKSITWKNNTFEMVGFVPGDAFMNQKPVGRGYAKLLETSNCPWPGCLNASKKIPAHEFHYATLKNLPSDSVFAYDVDRGYGINGSKDGIVIKNLLAGFTHRFSSPRDNWAYRFVRFVHQNKIQ